MTTIRGLLHKFGLTKLKLRAGFLEADWEPHEADRDAAWELYVELLTRIATQPLSAEHGDEKTALDSVYAVFPITRGILRGKGRECVQFTKIAVVVLNQVVRPFTARWHKLSLEGAFDEGDRCAEFRAELAALQQDLRDYTRLLAEIADVEDLTDMPSE
jgi:hypothetical protein